MTTALDTSVVVAALVRAHPHHARARPWLSSKQATTVVAAHALAEAWATITALPLEPRVTGAQASEMVRRLRKRVTVIAMSETIYRQAIDRCVLRGLRSGAIYDALHLVAAEARRADTLLTFNVADFVRLAQGTRPEIRVPD
jgi:predicted nucleic acid-binding protein